MQRSRSPRVTTARPGAGEGRHPRHLVAAPGEVRRVDKRTDRPTGHDGFGTWGHRVHTHDDDQFIAALSGGATIEAGGETFELGEGRGVWIPAGVPHSARFLPGFAPYVHRTGAPTGLTALPCAVVVTADLRGRLLASAFAGTDATAILCPAVRDAVRAPGAPTAETGRGCGPDGHIARLASAELRSPLTQAIGAALRTDPSDDRTLDDWARRLHTSATSIRRAFKADVGTSYTSWRTAVRLDASVALLRRGYPVASAARAVGLTHNGLLAAYRRHYGCRPSEIREPDGSTIDIPRLSA